VFMALSVGGLISYYFSSHIKLAPVEPPEEGPVHNIRDILRGYTSLVLQDKPFVSFISKRFVYLTGAALAAPLFPLFLVRVIQASDSWISIINTSQTTVLILGYYLWTRQSRRHGTRRVLLITTLGMALQPLLVAFTVQSWQVAILMGMAGIFQAGLDLVFFEELMRTVPPEYSATFVAFAQSIQYFSSVASPVIGGLLASWLGIPAALIIAGIIRLSGFGLFAYRKK